MGETPDIRYGRLQEAAHISGYSFERLCDELYSLLEGDEWQKVSPGYTDVNEFLKSIDLSPFNLGDNRPKLHKRIKTLQPKATVRAIGKMTGTPHTTVQDHVRDRTGVPAEERSEQHTSDEDVRNRTPAMPAGQDQADAILADIDRQVAERAETADPEPEPEDVGESPHAEPEPAPRVQVNEGDEWYTPKWLFDALGLTFSLDVCAPLDQTHSSVPADRMLTAQDDGLAQPWHGTVWCNPPYSSPEPWARRMIHHGDGLLLTHIPMNAGWCVDMWEACDAIRLFQAMEFLRPDGSLQRPGYWLQLAAFGPVATAALARLQPLGEAAANKRRVASPMWRRAT